MGDKGKAAKALSRNLHAAIERVREDVEKVEFWAEAVAEFSQPVPDYDPGKVNVWVPLEQATELTSGGDAGTNDKAKANRTADDKSRDRR